MHQRVTERRVAGATVRINGVAGIPAVLESLGASPAEVFAEARVDLALFDDIERIVPLALVGRLVKHCVAATGCQHFGLLVGRRGGVRSLGLVGLFMQQSPDVAAALGKLETFMHLYHGGQLVSIEVRRDVATLNYAIHEPGVSAVDQIEAGALAIFANVMRSLCGPAWRLLAVRFAHRKPRDVRPLLEFFQAPLRFEAEQNSLVFPSQCLQSRLPETSPGLQRMLQEQIDLLESRHRDDFPSRVRAILRAGLVTNHAGADEVAALFSMHRRTLTRRLEAFGTSFKSLVDEERFEMARQMLGNTSLEVSQIAAALQYADASAFTRAFRRWSGTTPAGWRETERRGRLDVEPR